MRKWLGWSSMGVLCLSLVNCEDNQSASVDSGVATDAAKNDGDDTECETQKSRAITECGADTPAGSLWTYAANQFSCNDSPSTLIDAWVACVEAAGCDAIANTMGDIEARFDPALLQCLFELPNMTLTSDHLCTLNETRSCASQLDSCEADPNCARWLTCHLTCQRDDIPAGGSTEFLCHSYCDTESPDAQELFDNIYECACELDGCATTYGIIGVHEGPGYIPHCNP